MQKMPFTKSLSYSFAKAVGKDILTSRMFMETVRDNVYDEFDSSKVAYKSNSYYFRWVDARPVAGEKDQYYLTQYVYKRHKEGHIVSGDKWYHENMLSLPNQPYFTREQAKIIITNIENRLQQKKNTAVVVDPPSSMAQFSIHRDTNKKPSL
jgi:hypothetical protein